MQRIKKERQNNINAKKRKNEQINKINEEKRKQQKRSNEN